MTDLTFSTAEPLNPTLSERAKPSAIASDTSSKGVLEKPKMGDYKRHLLVCVGPRCTTDGSSQALFEMLGDKFKQAGIDSGALRCKRTRTHCFATCKSGPIMAVQPDGIWYYNVTEHNLDRIIQQHLVDGVPVEDLIYHRGPQWGSV